MTSLPRPDNRLYLGCGGSGKTTLALEHAAKARRVLFVKPDDSEASPAGFDAARSRRELVERVMLPAWRLVFTTNLELGEWEWCNEAAWHAGDCVVVWEELGRYSIPGPLKGAAPRAFDLWMAGRHKRARVFACSQRPASVRPDFRANLSRAVIFRTIEADDLAWYRSMGERSMVEKIKALDFSAHEAIDWTPNGWSVKDAPFP